MNEIFLPGLIITGMVTLIYVSDNIADAIKTYSDKRNKENKAWNTKYTDAYFEDLVQRVEILQNDRTRKWKALNDIEILKGRLDVVDNWRKNTLKGYCFKRIEFEEKENKAHFLLVVRDPHRDEVLQTKHVECELVSKFSAQECIKEVAAPITIEQANDYFDNGFEWVPVYEKDADWPNMT